MIIFTMQRPHLISLGNLLVKVVCMHHGKIIHAFNTLYYLYVNDIFRLCVSVIFIVLC